MTFERPKVFEPMFDKELLGHENEEIVAIPSKGECVYDNGTGVILECVYRTSLCPDRPCGRSIADKQTSMVYLFKLEYMNAKLTSL